MKVDEHFTHEQLNDAFDRVQVKIRFNKKDSGYNARLTQYRAEIARIRELYDARTQYLTKEGPRLEVETWVRFNAMAEKINKLA